MRRGSRRETWWRGRRSISNSSKAEERPREERAASTLRIVSVWIPITRFILPLLLHLCVVRLTLSSFQKETCWAGVSFTTRPCPYRYYGLAWNGMSRKKTARTRSQERPQDLDRRDHLSFSLFLPPPSLALSLSHRLPTVTIGFVAHLCTFIIWMKILNLCRLVYMDLPNKYWQVLFNLCVFINLRKEGNIFNKYQKIDYKFIIFREFWFKMGM